MTDAPQPTPDAPIAGVILAGGRSRRFGADKAFAGLAGAPLIDHVIRRAAPQVTRLLISAADAARFRPRALPVVDDVMRGSDGGGLGPLAGIHAAMHWLDARNEVVRWLASFSVDTPLLPLDLVARLSAAAERKRAPLACVRAGGRLHPLLAVWSPALRDDLARALRDGELAAHRFLESHGGAIVDFTYGMKDPFANVNTPDDLARLERELGT